MSRNASDRLEDILAAINACFDYTQYLTDAKLSPMAMDAIERNLATIGEAVNHLPDSLTNQHPQIDWLAIIGLRNFLVHEYFAIDHEVIYEIVDKYLAPLKETVELAKGSF